MFIKDHENRNSEPNKVKVNQTKQS